MRISKCKFIASLVAAFIFGVILTGGIAAASGLDKDSSKYSKMDEIYDLIDSSYYKDVDTDSLMEGAYSGFVEALDDPYSAYMSKDEYESWSMNIKGEYSGVGITFSQDEDGNFVIVSVSKDSPAEKGGIKAGDLILKVDGKVYKNMDIMAQDIRGDEGTEVVITYSRDGKESEVTLKRANIVQHSVAYEMLENKIAHITITSFMETTADDFSAALEQAENEGAEGLVLDLRANGGGLVSSCVEVADEFLDKGVVVYVEDRNGESTDYKSKDGKTELKTAVLVDENSASAAEILAAAMQDNGFPLVGVKTFGKGVIQSTVILDDGSALKYTVMQYFSPKGKVIHENGVTPDYVIKNEDGSATDSQLEKALELVK